MDSSVVEAVLNRYGDVSRVHRRTYSYALDRNRCSNFHRGIHTEPCIPAMHVSGRALCVVYYVRYAGQPQRCYRYNPKEHRVRDCSTIPQSLPMWRPNTPLYVQGLS
jgi:hypothetical protein